MAFIYKLRKPTDHYELHSILGSYQRFRVSDYDVNRSLEGIKKAIGFNDLLNTCLNHYWIIGVGKHKEAGYHYVQKTNWKEAVERIRNTVPDDTILRLNLRVKKEGSKILPNEESKNILKSSIPDEAVVCLLENENTQAQESCFALYEQNCSMLRIYTACDIHAIIIKRKVENILGSFQDYNTLIDTVREAVNHYRNTFRGRLHEFTKFELEKIARGIRLHDAGSRNSTCNVYFYGTMKGYRTELIDKIVSHVTERLAKDLLKEIQIRLKSSLEYSFKLVSENLLTEIAHIFSFLPNILSTILRIIVELLSAAVLTIIYPVFAAFNPVDVNDDEWRHKVAGEVYSGISSHSMRIENELFKKLDIVLLKLQEELSMVNTTICRLKNLHVTDNSSSFTCDDIRKWEEDRST